MSEEELEHVQRRKAFRAALATRLLVVAVAVAICLIVGLLLVTVSQTNKAARGIAEDQGAAAVRGRGIASTAEQIESCTTPGRPCFERGQRQTASAIETINRVTILAAACADQPRRQTVEQIQFCVLRRLAAAKEPKP